MSNEGKVALVTGASRGIGKQICIELAKAGFDVVLAARSVEEQDTTNSLTSSLMSTLIGLQLLRISIMELELLSQVFIQ